MFVEHRSISLRFNGDECRFDQFITSFREQHLFVIDFSLLPFLLHFCFVSFFFSCILQILALLQDRQSNQSQSQSTSTNTPLTFDERTAESQALSNLKKAVEKHSGHFFGSRQQVKRIKKKRDKKSESFAIIGTRNSDEDDALSVELT